MKDMLVKNVTAYRQIFTGSVQISSLPSSKIYLNLENDYVNEMKIRYISVAIILLHYWIIIFVHCVSLYLWWYNIENYCYIILHLFNYCRLQEEGYKPAPNTQNSPITSSPAPVIETIALKELSQKTEPDDFEVRFLCFQLGLHQSHKFELIILNFGYIH